MTKNERLAIVDERIDAALDLLSAETPGVEHFNTLLQHTDSLMYLRNHVERTELPDTPCNPGPAPVTTPTVETPEPAPEQKPEAPTLTKDEVRKELSALQNNHGVDVPGVMVEMGFAKLSEIPAERYGELLKLANSKVG